MKKRDKNVILAFTVMILLLISFIMSTGTGDMNFWEEWMDNVNQYGIIEGYRMQHGWYPPFALLVQYIIKYFFSSLSNFAILRLTNTFFVIISLFITQLLFKDVKITFLVFSSLFFSSNLGYLDVEMAPFLLLAVYFFNRKKFGLSGLFFALLSLIKYQPLIIAPFILAYFVDIYDPQQQKYRLSIKIKEILQVSVPVVIIWAVVCVIFRREPLRELKYAILEGGTSIAPNGLNLGWIIQFLLERFRPEEFGELYNGRISIIGDATDRYLSFKYIFVVLYGIVGVLWVVHKEKNSQLALKFAIMAYTVYFLFNSGVHENHLFLAVLLMILLYEQEPTESNWSRAIIYIFIFNINLVIFYGVTGFLPIIRVIDGLFDPTLLLALFNVIYLIAVCFNMIREIYKSKIGYETGEKMLAIITGTINPDQKIDHLTLKDPQERLKQYLDSLCFLIDSGAFSSIIFCENSNYSLDAFEDIKSRAAEKQVKLEVFSFQGDIKEAIDHGKGYGEGEIMDYIFTFSNLLKEASYFVKITGRLRVDNMRDITMRMDTRKTYFNIPNRTIRDFYDTRIYAMPVEQFRTKFRNQYDNVSDNEGIFLENIYTRILREEKIKVTNFPRYPRIIGISGSMGIPYSYVEWKCRIKDLLSRFNYYRVD